jgi:hypothetical protein
MMNPSWSAPAPSRMRLPLDKSEGTVRDKIVLLVF